MLCMFIYICGVAALFFVKFYYMMVKLCEAQALSRASSPNKLYQLNNHMVVNKM